ncbi:MAG: large subunit ribosomal protein L31 [Myxococcota bacterium]|jgi:large subunit ribosomal protein L31
MKADIHPEYRFVVFKDIQTGFEFLTRSTIAAKETTTYEGQEYPSVTMEISSESHPFYTGTQKLMDTEGRVEKYYQKYGFQRTEEAGGDTAEAETAEA